jgi:hypothetical protein
MAESLSSTHKATDVIPSMKKKKKKRKRKGSVMSVFVSKYFNMKMSSYKQEVANSLLKGKG